MRESSAWGHVSVTGVGCGRHVSVTGVGCGRHVSVTGVGCERHASVTGVGCGRHISVTGVGCGRHVSVGCGRHVSVTGVGCGRHVSVTGVGCERHASVTGVGCGRHVSVCCGRHVSVTVVSCGRHASSVCTAIFSGLTRQNRFAFTVSWSWCNATIPAGVCHERISEICVLYLICEKHQGTGATSLRRCPRIARRVFAQPPQRPRPDWLAASGAYILRHSSTGSACHPPEGSPPAVPVACEVMVGRGGGIGPFYGSFRESVRKRCA